jgi:hypothetical protein
MGISISPWAVDTPGGGDPFIRDVAGPPPTGPADSGSQSVIRSILLAASSTLLLGAATAAVPDLDLSTYEIAPEAVGASVFVIPDGSGARFDQAFDEQGGVVDATIHVTLIDTNGDPIVAYPFEDMWLETTDGGLVACYGGTTADQSTDEHGQSFWLQPLRAGGCSVGELTLVMAAGSPLIGAGLPVVFRGPDLNGDLTVNLSDIVRMTAGIGTACN